MMAFIIARNTDMMNADSFNKSNPTDPFNDDFKSSTITHGSRHPPIPTTSTSPINFRDPSMPVTTSPQSLFASFPSLMSVFGDGTDVRRQRGGETLAISAPTRSVNVAKRPSPSSHFSSPIFRRDSASTFESAESSPTTTISTVDSSLTEPSPSSSPESPTSLLPLSSLKPLGIKTQSIRNHMESRDRIPNSLAALPGLNRADSPNKKMRNTKNLMVNTAASSRQVLSLPKLAISTGPAPDGHPFSAPATPSFIVPPKPPRRQPSNLGLTLSTPESMLNHHDNSNVVPPTPLDPHIRMLSYSHHSSSVPIFSPTVAPEGGMRLPPFGISAFPGCVGKTRPLLHASHHSSFENTNASPITRQTLDHVQEENDYDLPLSREAKSPAYPQGPVCIYEPYVYLYLEPTETEASEFDVILNVAREVKNPFAAAEKSLSQPDDTAMQISSESDNTFFAGRRTVSEPQTAISDGSFRSVFETELQDLSQDTGNIPTASITPEYIHIPWDHNTNVVDDLLRLCELIDERVQQKKRVLIHCQCGVSRSASLVVAYGLFKNPQLTVQDAYNVVKSHSKWIGPNMNLIYQLSEFKSNLARKTIPSAPTWHLWRGTGPEPKATTDGSFDSSITLPPPSYHGSPNEPSSAPYQTDRELQLPRANSLGTPNSSQMVEASVGDVTPGPSSAPPDMLWSPSMKNEERREGSKAAVTEEQRSASTPPKAMDVDTDDTPVPFTASLIPSFNEAKSSTSSPPPQLLPAGFSSLLSRRNGPQKLPLRQDSPRFTGFQLPQGSLDHAILDDVPKSPSLLSPRAAEFTASPFHRTAAGDLAGSSIFEQALMSPKPQDDDPRSPAQRGEAPITRSIFELL